MVDMRYTLNISHLTDCKSHEFKSTFCQISLIFPEVSNKYHFRGRPEQRRCDGFKWERTLNDLKGHGS